MANESPKRPPEDTDVPQGLVCLGASAGGLASLQAVLAALPADFPWPILVAQHLQPDSASILSGILQRSTALKVHDARAGEPVLPGSVYVGPSTAEIGVSPDYRIVERPITKGRPQRIDFLFTTASGVALGSTIAVVLSGEGSDGAAGALVVKLNGGTVIAESEDTSLHRSMPHAAAAAGTVDAFRDRGEISKLLVDLVGGQLLEANRATLAGVVSILELLSEDRTPDFVHYRRGTMRRRIQKRMAISGFSSLDDYREHLKNDAQARDDLRRSLLVLVTEFFRDPPAWDAVAEHVLPALRAKLEEGRPIRVWSAGCATGEEAYSLAILAHEAFPASQAMRIEIVATDLDEEALEAARSGVYNGARMRNVSPARLARYFDGEGSNHRLDESIRRMVRFERSDLSREAPEGVFDLVICRNVLIYFDVELQARVLALIHERTAPGGWLLLGRSEAPSRARLGFTPVVDKVRLFVKEGDGQAAPTLSPPPVTERSISAERLTEASTVYHRYMGDVLMRSTSMLALILDEQGRLLVANRLAKGLLYPATRGYDLSDVAGPSLTEAIRLALGSDRAAHLSGIGLDPKQQLTFDVTIEPLPNPERAVLVVGSAAMSPVATPEISTELPDPVADLLATNEELQTANEELAATNEELAATNEELQAANEEFSTLNEEFQSSNEVLDLRNQDLETEAADTPARGGLAAAVARAASRAIVAIDARKNVALCTAEAVRLLGLPSAAIGRPLSELDLPSPRMVDQAIDAAKRDDRATAIEVPTARGEKLRLVVEHVPSSEQAMGGWILSWTPP